MSKTMRLIGFVAMLIVAFSTLLFSLFFGGGAQAQLLVDPGVVVRFGVPFAQLAVNLAAALTLGALAFAIFAVKPHSDAFERCLNIAAMSAVLFTVASAFSGFFTFLNVTALPLSADEKFGYVLWQYLSSVPLGQSWLLTTVLAGILSAACFAVRNLSALFWVTILAVISLVPMAQQGHASGTSGHDAAITALFLHTVSAAAWIGGLAVLLLLRAGNTEQFVDLAKRYSTIALLCFIVLATSGYLSAELRIGTFERLFTNYGFLVLLKVGLLVLLGLIAALQRHYLLRKMEQTGKRSFFWRLVALELFCMGIASGVAVALSRTATPIPEVPAGIRTPAEVLTGSPVPVELTFSRYFTEFNPDLLWLLVCGFGIFFYLVGVSRLKRRGDRWPLYRVFLWITGMLVLAWVTSGSINVYQKYLFSTHMLGHMLIGMLVPLLLVPAAPVTLALRTIAKRTDGSRGAREWILLAIHSRFSSVISHPIVAAILTSTSLLVFYYTPLFRWSTTDHLGHEWMIIHFLIVGYLFVQALIGIDPLPHRWPHPYRLLLLLGTMVFHAFFGLALMTGSGLLLADWYGAMGRSWGMSAIADQQVGGGIAWSVGEIPTLILAIVVAVQWSRNDSKETKRLDRVADRTADAELKQYNAMLKNLEKKS